MDEPTTIILFGAICSMTAIVSSSQREIVPSAKAPPDTPWPE
jgi:hypothetical protein